MSPQVLVYDSIGSSWIDYCIPPKCPYITICLRKTLPIYLSYRFILRLLRLFFTNFREHPGWASYALLSALIEEASPRVILSAADNNPLLARYAADNPQIPVVLIQNALRDTGASFPIRQDLPMYLGFGEIERVIFRAIGIHCKIYQPIGSIKLGLSLTQGGAFNQETFDLAFISHYRPSAFHHSATILDQLIEENQNYLFGACVKYARKTTLKLAVILKSREPAAQEAERRYYQRLSRDVALHFTIADKARKELASYSTGLASDLIIHPGSTLGFELLGAGKKVIFGGTATPNLIKEWGVIHHVDSLPYCTKLRPGYDLSHFFSCADKLRSMPDAEYQENIRVAAKTFMSMPWERPPHETIKGIINDLM